MCYNRLGWLDEFLKLALLEASFAFCAAPGIIMLVPTELNLCRLSRARKRAIDIDQPTQCLQTTEASPCYGPLSEDIDE